MLKLKLYLLFDEIISLLIIVGKSSAMNCRTVASAFVFNSLEQCNQVVKTSVEEKNTHL
jgi:hypothetical protein